MSKKRLLSLLTALFLTLAAVPARAATYACRPASQFGGWVCAPTAAPAPLRGVCYRREEGGNSRDKPSYLSLSNQSGSAISQTDNHLLNIEVMYQLPSKPFGGLLK